MKQFRFKVAGKVFEVNPMFSRIKKICRGFITDDDADFNVICSLEEFDKEIEKLEKLIGVDIPSDVHIEVEYVHQFVTDTLIDDNVILMHGAVVAIGDNAYVFSAPSSTGKTTHIMKWLERLPDAFVVNGDKPFIKFNDDGTVLACGSPWAGKENMYTNTMVPLKAIVLMERAEDNSIERISFAEAFPKLLEQTYRPEDPDKMRKTLKLMQRLNPAVSFWRFKFNNMKDDCFDVAYNALVGQDQ